MGARVFVDFNQNAPHKTVFGAWFATTAGRRAGLDPTGVGRGRLVDPEELTIRTVPELVRRAGDPWAGIGRRPPVAPAAAGHGRHRTGPTGCTTPRGRPSTPSSPTSRPGWHPSRAKKG